MSQPGENAKLQRESASKPLRILIATHSSLEVGGGEELKLMALARALTYSGYEVRIANMDSAFREEKRTTIEDVSASLSPITVVPVPASRITGRVLPVPGIRGLRVLAEEFTRADVVIFGQYYGFDLTILVLKLLRRKPILCMQSNALFRSIRDQPTIPVQEAYARLVGARILLRCDSVTVCNSEDLTFLKRHGYSRAHLLYPISTGSSLAPGPLPEELAERIRSDARFKVFIAGRMTSQKGVDLIAEMLEGMITRNPNLASEMAFYFAGTHSLPPNIEKLRRRLPGLFANLGVLPNAVFLSVLEKVDLVFVPSRYESFGRISAEAQAAGKPVIATDVPGLRETVEDGRSGILVKTWSPTAFADALRFLYQASQHDPSDWYAMQEAARAHFEKKFGREVQAAQYAEFVESIAQLADLKHHERFVGSPSKGQ